MTPFAVDNTYPILAGKARAGFIPESLRRKLVFITSYFNTFNELLKVYCPMKSTALPEQETS